MGEVKPDVLQYWLVLQVQLQFLRIRSEIVYRIDTYAWKFRETIHYNIIIIIIEHHIKNPKIRP